MDSLAPVLFGFIVGLSLGLTGGGGSILAVPMLVYGLHLQPQRAALVSLCAVGSIALVGAVRKMVAGEVERLAGLLLGISGVLGAPLGIWLARYLPAQIMLILFSVIMVWVAIAMWRRAQKRPWEGQAVREAAFDPFSRQSKKSGPGCSLSPQGKLILTSRCTVLILATGALTGLLSGLFGVGGGFIVVPALIALAGLDIRRAVATSLLVVALVSASGVVSGILAGRTIPVGLTLLFGAGGLGGLLAGIGIGVRLPAPTIQKIFSVVIGLVAVYVAVKSFMSL